MLAWPKRLSKYIWKNSFPIPVNCQEISQLSNFPKTTALFMNYSTYSTYFGKASGAFDVKYQHTKVHPLSLHGPTVYSLLTACTPAGLKSYFCCPEPLVLTSFFPWCEHIDGLGVHTFVFIFGVMYYRKSIFLNFLVLPFFLIASKHPVSFGPALVRSFACFSCNLLK